MSQIKWNLPLAVPGGEMLPHMSARRRTEIIDQVFDSVGGPERLAAWAGKNDENYGDFITKIWGKGAARVTSAEIGISPGVEGLIKQLEKRDRERESQIVDSTCVEVDS
jgi:hypothetical protein